MNSKELRIGVYLWNEVQNCHYECRILDIERQIGVERGYLENNVSPVPIILTPEWAIKLGFTKSCFSKWRGNGYDYQPIGHYTERTDFVHENGQCFISFQKNYFNNKLDSESINFYHNEWYKRCTEGQIFADISQVHKLQNLFFILFNK